MPKAQVQFLDDSGAVLYSSAATVDDTFANRFFTAYKSLYGQVPVDPEATPVVMRDMTDDEVYSKWAGGLMVGTIGNIQSTEIQTAVAAIQPDDINFTPVT